MNTKEYNECVRLHSDALFRYAISMLREVMLAEDIVQNVFEKLWIKKDNVQFETSKSYLMTSVYRASIDHFRSAKSIQRLKDTVGPAQDTHTQDNSYEYKQILNLALETLNEKQKSVILLRDHQGYSYKEIAKMMDLTEAQVKINIFRGRKKLQEVITAITV